MKTFLKSILAVVFLACGISAYAQSGGGYSLTWSTIDGGGGTSTGGVYSVTGTIGQPDAGTASGGIYSLTGGFWGIVAAIQTPGAPLLTITRSGGNVIISWPSPSTGFNLQFNSALGNGAWATQGGVIDDGVTKSVSVPAGPGNKFYRLQQ